MENIINRAALLELNDLSLWTDENNTLDTHLHSTFISMSYTQIQPFPRLHFGACRTRALLLQSRNKGVREVLRQTSADRLIERDALQLAADDRT